MDKVQSARINAARRAAASQSAAPTVSRKLTPAEIQRQASIRSELMRRKAEDDSAPKDDADKKDDDTDKKDFSIFTDGNNKKDAPAPTDKKNAPAPANDKKDAPVADDKKEARAQAIARKLRFEAMRRKAEQVGDSPSDDLVAVILPDAASQDGGMALPANADEAEAKLMTDIPIEEDDMTKLVAAFALVKAQKAHRVIDASASDTVQADKVARSMTLKEIRLITANLNKVGSAEVKVEAQGVPRRATAQKSASSLFNTAQKSGGSVDASALFM